MRQLTSDEYEAFVTAKAVAAIHYDAAWDVGYRSGMRRQMLEAADAFGEQANFAEVDVDSQHELAKALPVLNVPTVAYYRDGALVAALVGAHQNVGRRVERLLHGESIGYKDGADAA